MGYIIYTDRQLKLYLLADRPWRNPTVQYNETLFTTESLRPVIRPIGLIANRNGLLSPIYTTTPGRHRSPKPPPHIPPTNSQLPHFSSWL